MSKNLSDNYKDNWEESVESNTILEESSKIIELSENEEDIKQIWPKKFKKKDNIEKTCCKVIDDKGERCPQEYKNLGSSTGNLITHLRDAHSIVDPDTDEQSKAKKARKLL
ncbi:13479_t:CDS:2 [Cetraspora pellucida]|uniref:13479_t:CDS:1 n=1 Tax=Cetraspora pellucida TaxID=1433469 RepID=A0ACA9LSQ5_9GLOM|nr:13479_t:CDS:2 [Cetraspora pellucida]